MCTLILLFRPAHPWPLILGANRDEMRDRPWRAPGRHWPERPEVMAGLDLLGGGSWLGLNSATGLVAAILNRRGSLGPQPGKRSRGELVLRALDAESARAAAAELAAISPADYRSFNLVVADRRDAVWLRHLGPEATRGPEAHPLPPGLTLLTAGDRNDPSSPRIRRYLPRLEAAAAPDPGTGDWAAWQAILADRGDPGGADPMAAMNLGLASGFGTVSSSLIALGQDLATQDIDLQWLFAAGRPDEAPYLPANLHG
ncbi:MAG: NRDE family protein [Kiloniellales bacterium]|nr:NRDE family protein [Kiloniellales bacterium]